MSEDSLERRLSAVVIADIAGYTRLIEEDTDGTVTAWKSARADVIDPGMAKFSGRIVKYTGDGFLAEFGSVQDAVNFAVEMQRDLSQSPLEFRTGIALGDVVDDGKDIHGEGVNIAARIEALAEPGGVSVSSPVYDAVKNRVDAKFVDTGVHKVKNVSDPVRVYHVEARRAGAVPKPDKDYEPGTKPSIAVLPFQNMSDDPEQVFFADGIAEDIITELSKFHSLFVIARNSSFSYRGRALDIKEISEKLGVRYIVEGGVRRARDRVRITAQLIDAKENKHLWADRYDRNVEDIFAVQDEVTFAIVTAIEPQLAISERQRALRKHPENLDAWENYQRGLWHMFQYLPEERHLALRFLERAIELDPTFASAYAGLSYALYTYIILGAYDDRERDLQRAFEAAHTAVRLDESDPFAWVALTRGYLLRGEPDSAIAAADKAIAQNPNLALAHFGRAHALWHAGRPEEAIGSHDEALRLSPDDPLKWAFLASKAIAVLMLGDFEKAVSLSRESQREVRSAIFSHLAEISACGHLGLHDEARIAIARAREKKPDLSVSYIAEALPVSDRHCRQFFHDGLRTAGLPD